MFDPIRPPNSTRGARPRSWLQGALAASLVAVLLGGPARAEEARGKVSPSLIQAAAAAPGDTVTVWITFADKGERGPADLARRLADAEAALAPRARARRLRAGVRPLMDYRDLPVEPAYLQALAARGLVPIGASRWFNRAAVRAPAGALLDLAALPSVQGLAPVERLRRSTDPENAPPAGPARAAAPAAVDYGQTTSQLAQIGVPALHDSGYTGAGVLICVLDEGFNFFDTHEALREHVIPAERQRDFHRGVSSAQDPLDGTMVHGTWVLGVMAGRKFGTYVGAAYDAEYALARTEVRSFERTLEMIYWGMGAEWADSLGADVINSSLGYTTFDSAGTSYGYADMDGQTTVVTQAARIAAAKGILVVNSVGNDGASAWRYLGAPSDAHGDSVIAVGAVDENGVPAAFSSYGPSADGRVKPDLAARGVSNPIVNAYGDTAGYGPPLSGTSFSAPLVAGLAACLMEARPQWTPRDVARALRASASQASAPDYRVGYGIPNGLLALGSQDSTGAPPPGRLVLRLAGPNPVDFGRGPARFSLAAPLGACGSPAAVRVLDAQGRRVRGLWAGVVSCGLAFSVTWDGLDDRGRAVAPGLYIVDFQAGGHRASVRLVALR